MILVEKSKISLIWLGIWFCLGGICLYPSYDSYVPGMPFMKQFDKKTMSSIGHIWSIVQDDRGVMFFATSSGLLEYDGAGWRAYQIYDGGVIRCLVKGENGRIYLGCNGEMGYLDYADNGSVQYVSLVPKLPESERNFADIWRVCATDTGIYFFTFKHIYCYENNQMTVIPFDSNSWFGFVLKNRVFVAGLSEGLYLLHEKKVIDINFNPEVLKNPRRIALLPYSDSHFLIATQNHGFFLGKYPDFLLNGTDPKDPQSLQWEVTKFETEIDKFINTNGLYTYTSLNNQYYSFSGLSGNGIIIMNREGKLHTVINKPKGLQGNICFSTLFDRDQNLWAGLNNGIAYLELSSPIRVFGQYAGIENQVFAAGTFNGTLFAGTLDGLKRLPEYQLELKDDSHRFEDVREIRRDCRFILPLEKGGIAAGMHEFLLIQKRVKAYSMDRFGFVLSLYKSRHKSHTLFAGSQNGLALLKYRITQSDDDYTLQITHHRVFKNIPGDIISIVEDEEGHLWLTSNYKGIYRMVFTKPDMSQYRGTLYNSKHGLPSDAYNFVHWVDDQLQVATGRGVYRLKTGWESAKGDEPIFEPHPFWADKPFSQISFRQIEPLGAHRYMINYGGYIGYYHHKDSGDYTLDNIPFRRIPLGSYTFNLEPDGVVLVCSDDGLYRFNPKISKNYQVQYSTLIRRVTINNREVVFDGTYPGFSNVQPAEFKFQLPYKKNTLTFEYSASFYEGESPLYYTFFLTGFDQRPNTPTTETKQKYTNLPAGDFSFDVRAENIFGVKGDPCHFEFSILSPWYQTPLAFIGYILTFVMIIFGAVRLNSRRLLAAQRRLEKLVAERTQDLKEANEQLKDFAYIVSHDLKAPLRGIHQVSSWIKHDYYDKIDDEGKEQFDLLGSRVKRMENLIDGILKYSRASSKNQKIEDIDLAEVIPEFIESIAPPDHIQVTIESELPVVRADKTRVVQLFQNIVSNAIKYNDKPEGHVRIGCSDEDTHWQFYIADNGPGIDDKYKDKVFQIFQTLGVEESRESTGVGLSVVKKIVELYGGRIWLESELTKGTTFFFTFSKSVSG